MRTVAVFQHLARDRSGLAAIELAIIAPVVLVCALAVADLGRFALDKTWVTYAASAGAEYAVAEFGVKNTTTGHAFGQPFNSDDIAAIKNAAQSAAASGVSASPDPSAFYGCATATGVTASTQGATCPSGTSTGGVVGQYVTVTTTMPFTALFSAPGISYPSTITATAVVRVQ